MVQGWEGLRELEKTFPGKVHSPPSWEKNNEKLTLGKIHEKK